MDTRRGRCPCGAEYAEAPWVVAAYESHGLTPLCADCQATDPAGAIARAATEARKRQLDRLRAAARIPAKWRSVALGELDVDAGRAEAIAAASEWALGKRRRGLLFHGAVGRGKTAIAAAAANGLIERGRRVRWLPVGELLMGLRMPFDSPEYLRATKALEPRGAALVLDDLDKVRPSEHSREPIYVAVNAWVEAELPLIVTMNRDLDALEDDFGDRYGPAIASRLAGYCDQFDVRGRDRRLA